MKKYYHATSYDNLNGILCDGLKTSMEGIVYMAETPIDAVKFVALRMTPKILVVEIKTLKKHEENIIETTDHNYDFFKCKSFGYVGDIDSNMITNYLLYDNPLFGR